MCAILEWKVSLKSLMSTSNLILLSEDLLYVCQSYVRQSKYKETCTEEIYRETIVTVGGTK